MFRSKRKRSYGYKRKRRVGGATAASSSRVNYKRTNYYRRKPSSGEKLLWEFINQATDTTVHYIMDKINVPKVVRFPLLQLIKANALTPAMDLMKPYVMDDGIYPVEEDLTAALTLYDPKKGDDVKVKPPPVPPPPKHKHTEIQRAEMVLHNPRKITHRITKGRTPTMDLHQPWKKIGTKGYNSYETADGVKHWDVNDPIYIKMWEDSKKHNKGNPLKDGKSFMGGSYTAPQWNRNDDS
jgi:hypothetical protein